MITNTFKTKSIGIPISGGFDIEACQQLAIAGLTKDGIVIKTQVVGKPEQCVSVHRRSYSLIFYTRQPELWSPRRLESC